MKETRFELADLRDAVQKCAHDWSAGSLVSTFQAVEELRVLTGDFQTSDEEMANALAEAALNMGCSVAFDEQAGAEVLRMDDLSPRR